MAEMSKGKAPVSSPVASVYCEHGRLGSSCEDCAHVRYLERTRRAANRDHDPKRAPRNLPGGLPEHDVVDQDTHVLRVDLAHGDDVVPRTLVRSGDAVPPALVNLPRETVPADQQLPRPGDTPPAGPVVSVV